MKLRFSKYHGTGNDFILINNMDGRFKLSDATVRHLCHRHFGIGSDGIILLEESADAEFHMNFYNPDGSQSFCGNGSRCAVLFALDMGLVETPCTFSAIDGVHEAFVVGELIRIHMKDVVGVKETAHGLFIHTGSPHLIIHQPEAEKADILPVARSIRYGSDWKEQGVNVNFVEEKEGELFMRTYERGVEDETLSCGTGVTAVALGYGWKNPGITEVHVVTPGGRLKVYFEQTEPGHFTNIWLEGPAKQVFHGETEMTIF